VILVREVETIVGNQKGTIIKGAEILLKLIVGGEVGELLVCIGELALVAMSAVRHSWILLDGRERRVERVAANLVFSLWWSLRYWNT